MLLTEKLSSEVCIVLKYIFVPVQFSSGEYEMYYKIINNVSCIRGVFICIMLTVQCNSGVLHCIL